MILRCRKCRHNLVPETPLAFVNAHGEAEATFQLSSNCRGEENDNSWFVNETSVPWILEEINKCQWTKGKLNCPKCGARVGGFDYISRTKCTCGYSVLPPVHFVKSKVDHKFPIQNSLSLET